MKGVPDAWREEGAAGKLTKMRANIKAWADLFDLNHCVAFGGSA